MNDEQYKKKVTDNLASIAKSLKAMEPKPNRRNNSDYVDGALYVLNNIKGMIIEESVYEIENKLREKGWNGSYGESKSRCDIGKDDC